MSDREVGEGMKRGRNKNCYITEFRGVLDNKPYLHIRFAKRIMVIAKENFNVFIEKSLLIELAKQRIRINKSKRK